MTAPLSGAPRSDNSLPPGQIQGAIEKYRLLTKYVSVHYLEGSFAGNGGHGAHLVQVSISSAIVALDLHAQILRDRNCS